MEQESITFSVQMTVKEIYRFTIYHVYHGFSGIFGLCLSLAALVNLIVSFDSLSDQGKAIMTIVAAWFTVLEPLMMLWRAKGQVKRNASYKQPLNYTVNNEGITVSQNEERQTIPWERLVKIVETHSQYLIYSSKIHAFIFPKSAIGEQDKKMEELLLQCSEGTGVRLKGAIKRRKS